MLWLFFLGRRKQVKRIIVLLFAVVVIMGFTSPSHAGDVALADSYQFNRMWPQLQQTQTWYFDCPHSVAVDSSGNVYVADSCEDCILKFDSNGTYLTQWGSFGTGNGQFNNANAVAVGGSGNVYVAD